MTYQELFNETKTKIKEYHVIKELILHHAKLSSEQLLRVMEEKINFNYNAFARDVDAYLSGVPVQHIVGSTSFRGLTIRLEKSHAFIPRFETEYLIDLIQNKLEELNFSTSVNVADIGTGSGVIALSISKELTGSRVHAVEKNPNSYNVAKNNFELHDADINLYLGNMLDPLIDNGIKVDILISNPPYIPTSRMLDKRVHNHDPHMALYGGEDGLIFFKEIFRNAKHILNNKNIMAFEHDESHVIELEELVMKYFPTHKYKFEKDLAGKPRFLLLWN